jgi:hypothetical protein
VAWESNSNNSWLLPVSDILPAYQRARWRRDHPSSSCIWVAPLCPRPQHGNPGAAACSRSAGPSVAKLPSLSGTNGFLITPSPKTLPSLAENYVQAPSSDNASIRPLGMGRSRCTTCDRKVIRLIVIFLGMAYRTRSYSMPQGPAVLPQCRAVEKIYKVYSPAPRLLDHLPTVNPQYRLQR